MKKTLNYAFMLLLAFAVFNVFFKNNAEADPKQSYQSLISGKAVFIDVREESEVKEGMIKGALWFPLSKIENDKPAAIAKIKEMTKDKQVYLYCRSGNRSGKVKSYLEEAGIKAINMGGFSSLVKEKLPVQSHL